MTRTCGNCVGFVDGICQPAQDCCLGSSVTSETPACEHWDARTHGNCKQFEQHSKCSFLGVCKIGRDGRRADGSACERWVGR